MLKEKESTPPRKEPTFQCGARQRTCKRMNKVTEEHRKQERSRAVEQEVRRGRSSLVVREGFSEEVTFAGGRSTSQVRIGRKGFPGKGSSKYKGPAAGGRRLCGWSQVCT